MSRFLVLSFALVAVSGCATVLGFEAASLDPELQDKVASPDAGMPDQPLTLCEEFCQTVMEACPVTEGPGFAVYDSRVTCERQCEFFEEGARGDEVGNSIQCRLTSARVALLFPGERATACPAAGPGGNGICGNNCEGYCTVMQAECSEFASDAECRDACQEVPDNGGFDISIIEGDSLQCRLYHLNAALVSPLNHCPHAAGAAPCSATLEDASVQAHVHTP